MPEGIVAAMLAAPGRAFGALPARAQPSGCAQGSPRMAIRNATKYHFPFEGIADPADSVVASVELLLIFNLTVGSRRRPIGFFRRPLLRRTIAWFAGDWFPSVAILTPNTRCSFDLFQPQEVASDTGLKTEPSLNVTALWTIFCHGHSEILARLYRRPA